MHGSPGSHCVLFVGYMFNLSVRSYMYACMVCFFVDLRHYNSIYILVSVIYILFYNMMTHTKWDINHYPVHHDYCRF